MYYSIRMTNHNKPAFVDNESTNANWLKRLLIAGIGCLAVIIAGDPEAFSSKK